VYQLEWEGKGNKAETELADVYQLERQRKGKEAEIELEKRKPEPP
jgi:transposase